MSKSVKIRKPRRVDRGGTPKDIGVYADFDETKECCVYVGGRYYQDSAQIHLNEKDVHTLARFLGQASAYLKAKKATAPEVQETKK